MFLCVRMRPSRGFHLWLPRGMRRVTRRLRERRPAHMLAVSGAALCKAARPDATECVPHVRNTICFRTVVIMHRWRACAEHHAAVAALWAGM